MAIRDAGDFGFDMSLEDAVKKARREKWSDRDIVALLSWRNPAPTEDEIRRIPREIETIRLEDLKFRPNSEGGMTVERLVDGRPKTESVPMVVGQILEAMVKEFLEVNRERSSVTSRVNGDSAAGRPADRPVRRGPAKAKKAARSKN